MTLLAAIVSDSAITIPVWMLLAIASVVATGIGVYTGIVRKISALGVKVDHLTIEITRLRSNDERHDADITRIGNNVHGLRDILTAPVLQFDLEKLRAKVAAETVEAAEVAARAARPPEGQKP